MRGVYEAVFQPCSYRFRPGRDAHQALTALDFQLAFRPINWVYEADVQGFFDHLDHEAGGAGGRAALPSTGRAAAAVLAEKSDKEGCKA